MISFTCLTRDNEASLARELGAALGDVEYVSEILSSFVEIAGEGAEVAVTTSHGCLLTRIFDSGRYSFVYPIEISDGGDATAALTAVVDYCVRELVPVYVTDTPREELDGLGRIFPRIEAHAYDDDIDSFALIICSECDELDEVPTYEEGGITLNEITDADAARYAALCRSEAVNRYWGYDYKEDADGADDGYFTDVVRGEFARGVALSLAVRESQGTELLGEAVIFDFDYRGGAKIAVRLHKDAQGRGIGSAALSALIALARKIGLKRLTAEVMTENTASIKMTARQMTYSGESDGKTVFVLDLD